MTHFVTEHPEYRRGHTGKKLYRTASCWSCAKEIERGEDDRYRCSCGFVLPRKDPETGTWIPEDLKN